MRPAYLKILLALERRPLRFHEIFKESGVKSKASVSEFLNYANPHKLIEPTHVDSEKGVVATAYRLSDNGKTVLFHIKQIDDLLIPPKKQ